MIVLPARNNEISYNSHYVKWIVIWWIIHASPLEKLADPFLICNSCYQGCLAKLRQVFVVVGPLQY